MTHPTRDRRRHTRHELVCPVVVVDEDGHELCRTRTVNVSDGGMLLSAGDRPIDAAGGVHVNLRVPRQTVNTFMYEDFFSVAEVVRRQPNGGTAPAVAVKFPRSLKLDLQA